jgi:23S rRNA pseudouridine1911/1915/1917 synthase
MKLNIPILYEDKDILAIDKPAGISVHQDGRSKEVTIADWFAENYPKSKNVGESMVVGEEEIKRPGIVHRLDRETSGVMLLAKNKKTYEFLKQQFQDRKIKKTYITIVSGFIKNDSGIINKPIGRSPNDFRRRLAGRGARGELREAVTEFKVLKRFEDSGEKYSVLEVYPKTGRTHQIRVHMKFFSHPVVHDTLYNPKQSCPKSIKRLALHAKSIEFKNIKGEKIKIESPLPKEFARFLS